MKIIRIAICLILCLAFVLGAVSCTPANPKPQSRSSFEYFDTVSTFYDYSGASSEDFTSLASRFFDELAVYHKLYDIYNEYEGVTNIATLNRLAGCGAQKVDEKIVDMLLFAKEMYLRTAGEVNVAMGAVLKIWHEYREAGRELPPMELLTAAAEHINIDDLIIDEENLTVELRDSEMRLDVGAVAKGYAVEMISRSFENDGFTSLVLDVGGNLRAVGTKPDGSGWVTGVQNPDIGAESSYVYKTELKNGAIVTSGSYQRFYTVGGVRYHHIINGDSLMPENHYLSVSVMSDSSALSDALSTAIFNMEYEAAKEFIRGFRGITVILVLLDGSVEELAGATSV